MNEAAYKINGHSCARCGLFLGSEFRVPSYHAKCKRLPDAELLALFDAAEGIKPEVVSNHQEMSGEQG